MAGCAVKLSLILAPLIAAKVPHEVLMDTILAFEAQQTDAIEKRRANDRDRQARQRLSRDVTGSHTVSRSHTRVEDSSSKKEDNKEEKKDRAPAALTPCQELESVLDHEHAQAVVDHRQRLKKPLTAYAAKQLASKLSKAPDANVAADAMIANGWQGFEAEWLTNRTTGPPSKPKKQTLATMWHDEARQHGIIDDPSSPPNGRVVPSLPAGQNQSPGVARRYAGT
jgi:hypothetical protein